MINPTNEETALSFSVDEIREIHVLIVDPDTDDRKALKDVLGTFGFPTLVTANTHDAGLSTFCQHRFTHVFVSARSDTIPVPVFLQKIIELDPQIVVVPVSAEPSVDDVFALLQIGARGFLVKPFTHDTLEQSLLQATKGEPFSQAILRSANRNEAFAALMGAALDRAATTKRQARTYDTAARDCKFVDMQMRSMARLATTFAEGGTDSLLEEIVEFFLTLGNGPSSRLGRLRKRLRKDRVQDGEKDSKTP